MKGSLGRTVVLCLLAGSWVLPPPMVGAQETAPPEMAQHRPVVTGPHGLVSADNPLASMAGLRLLMAGGNAVDAAVATLAALHVVRPQMSGMDGNGFLTIYDRKTDRVYSLNGTGAAPKALDAAKLTPAELNKGIHAGAVPGLFGAWIAALDRFGTMSLAQVMAPALDYAENGHPIEKSVVEAIANARDDFAAHPTSMAMFMPDGRVPVEGETFKMPALAATMHKLLDAERHVLETGGSRHEALQAAFDRFYKGDIAREMARFYEENGGEFRYEDFATYEPIWAEPVHTTYRGFDVYTSPTTSRGGLEVAMQLNLVEGYDLASMGHDAPETVHLLAEAIKVAKSDIYHYVADPKFATMPTAGLLDKDYAVKRRKLIDRSRAVAFPEHGNPPGADKTGLRANVPRGGPKLPEPSWDGSTTSFAVADQSGNVVQATPTHGGLFGTGVVVGNTGLLFNNGTRIGSTSPYPDDVNYVRGGQIPILNNSPTIIMKDGTFYLAIGTPGGETIGQTEFQAIVNVLDFGMNIQEAVAAPRFVLTADPNFYRAGSRIRLNLESRYGPELARALEAMGHEVRLAPGYSFGSMNGILRDPVTGTLFAGADPRRVGYAVGW